MTDERIDSLSELVAAVEAFRDERDWAQFHSPRNLAAAIAIEAAELQEVFLWQRDGGGLSEETLRRLEDEVADVMIHCANLASAAGIDLPAVVARKLRENAAKYPVEKARGSAVKYTDL